VVSSSLWGVRSNLRSYLDSGVLYGVCDERPGDSTLVLVLVPRVIAIGSETGDEPSCRSSSVARECAMRAAY
jgi:hypothetical protein